MKHVTKLKYITVFAALMGVLMSVAASASDLPQTSPVAPKAPLTQAAEVTPTTRSDWALQITPYVWGAGLNGSVSPFSFAPTIHVEKSFGDVMKDFNIGGFLHVWGRRGPFVLGGDFMYVSTTERRSLEPVPIVGSIRGRLRTDLFYASLLGGYRVIDAQGVTIDLLVGGRVWNVFNGLSLNIGPLALGHAKSFAWIDPLVGVRGFWNLTDNLSVMAQGDIGGFGAGSKLTWQGLGTVNYAFTDHLSASAGYKVLKVDYARGGYVFDVTMSGPVVGVTYRF